MSDMKLISGLHKYMDLSDSVSHIQRMIRSCSTHIDEFFSDGTDSFLLGGLPEDIQ